MRLHRIICEFERWGDQRLLVTDPAVLHQITRVLRLGANDQLIIVLGAGQEAIVRISSDSSKKVLALDVISIGESHHDPDRIVTLCAAVLKKESFEWVVQKATEVGVARIVPLITSHTVKTGLSIERMQVIAREAAEQSGRTTIPEVISPCTLTEAMTMPFEGRSYWADIVGGESATTLGGADVRVFIGPEGGWSEDERAMALRQGCSVLSLGRTVLRAETAAIVAVHRLVNSFA